ncbi:hypothetical protein RRG08_056126 [Elysia crispata]|uniref:Uncharacterized protein n=1 Tax=Elysia crispata TaxID=231223 RepID=A0AAE1D5N8_9GAST|nr:hypothetical protein RRG08_056126 [Elysia crispata]
MNAAALFSELRPVDPKPDYDAKDGGRKWNKLTSCHGVHKTQITSCGPKLQLRYVITTSKLFHNQEALEVDTMTGAEWTSVPASPTLHEISVKPRHCLTLDTPTGTTLADTSHLAQCLPDMDREPTRAPHHNGKQKTSNLAVHITHKEPNRATYHNETCNLAVLVRPGTNSKSLISPPAWTYGNWRLVGYYCAVIAVAIVGLPALEIGWRESNRRFSSAGSSSGQVKRA